MSDRDALLAAIRAQPDEDTPRLVFADYLEENGEHERAAFIRAQVELARTPPWEPFAVRCRWREPEIVSGARFRDTLPQTDGSHIAWDSLPFRRGFGWSLFVRTPSQWAEFAEPIFAQEPVGKVTFWQGTLDDWGRIASSDYLRYLRELTFNANPIEPLWALRDVPAACGITDLHFGRASGAGMPVVMDDLFRSPLGRAIRGLSFHAGPESLNELIDAIGTGGPLERLSFSLMNITADHLRRLFAGPTTASLTKLHLRDEPLGDDGLRLLANELPTELNDLALASVGVRAEGLEALARSDRLANLRRLSLNRNPLTRRAMKVLALSRSLAGLRSLDLSSCRIDDRGVRHLTRAKFWLNLVEVDLRQNPISATGAKHLLDAPRPPDLTALVLDGDSLGSDSRAALAQKYGDAAVFAVSEVPG